MKLNTLSKAFATKGSFQLTYNFATLLLLAAMASIGFASWAGFRLGFAKVGIEQPSPLAYPSAQISEKSTTSGKCEQHLKILTEHLGRIEANLMRINALGGVLVETAGLDPNEFNFNQQVPMGGPLYEDSQDNLLQSLKILDANISKRMALMSALHVALHTKLGHQELCLTGPGKSATEGWISSFYGARHDPFTGRKAWHAGVDIVGKEGSKVKALAGGIVSYAATKGGYGQLVEIQHANGLSTRYGHNKEILVQPGDLVKKGQDIALLGSTGRSTGPHLHLEVHRNGEAVDPGEYFPDLKRK